jgi:hypothetical protein
VLHEEQELRPDEAAYIPGEQSSQADEPVPVCEYPGLQLVHSEAGDELEYIPIAQFTQETELSDPEAEYAPTVHIVHPDDPEETW